ncbi:alpha/beta hydrolase [Desulfovibrio sp. OttesenSCG-928-C06]|nr:alpha/beta hydrolase [Desulfovibrio sp. OttesenSCG-928-C06]
MSGHYIRPDVKEFLDFANSQAAKRKTPPDLAKMRYGSEEARKHCDLPLTPLAPLAPLAVDQRIEIPGPAGTISARIFDARERREPGPIMLFFHGGGFVVCSVDSHESATAEIARVLDIPVISVDYRLAPEHPWPAAHDDGEAAARWLASSPPELAELGFTPTSLLLCGDSAGGNLSLVTALALRDVPAPLPVSGLLLFFPATDLAARGGSFDEFGDGYLLNKDGMAFFRECFKPDPSSWRASPMLADFAGLPPVIINACSLDPFRDQGRDCAAKLAQAGNNVYFYESQGLPHAWLTNRKSMPSAQADMAHLLGAAKVLLLGSQTSPDK